MATAACSNAMKESRSILSKLEENLGIACTQISEDIPAIDASSFVKENFWKNFIAATKLISHEATKFCMMFSKPPFPTKEETQQICDKIESTCLSFVSIYFTLPKSKGRALHREIHNYLLSILQGMRELCTAAKNNSSAQLQTVGNMWEKCANVENLSKDNKDAAIVICRNEHDVVQDACTELMNAMENEDEDAAEEFFVPNGDLNVAEGSWTESDRQVLLPCSGLIKAAKACLKKTLISITERGNGDDEQFILELDETIDRVKLTSTLVDDFVLSLYPPMNHSDVRIQAAEVRNHCKNFLAYVKHCHFCTNIDEKWILFLEKAVDHNWVKINDLVLAD